MDTVLDSPAAIKSNVGSSGFKAPSCHKNDLPSELQMDRHQADINDFMDSHDQQAQDEEEAGTSFLNDENAFPRSPNKKKCPEADQAEKEFLESGKKLEETVFAPQAIDVFDQNEDCPKRMVDQPSELALKFISDLETARANNDGEKMSDLVFDADCEDLGAEIDLQWYEKKAQSLLQNEEM